MALPAPLEELIEAFGRFPGIGRVTAERLAFHVLRDPKAAELAGAIERAATLTVRCSACGNVAEGDPCIVCDDPARDGALICVVEEPHDVYVMENVGHFKGVYHVLGGLLSPLDGIGPDDLHIDSLMKRVSSASELIVATDASVEGDATALYIQKILNTESIKMTRLARGLPVGGHLEYVDEATLTRSINERVELHCDV